MGAKVSNLEEFIVNTSFISCMICKILLDFNGLVEWRSAMYPALAAAASALVFLRVCRPSVSFRLSSGSDAAPVTELTLLGQVLWPKLSKTNSRWPSVGRRPLNFGLALYLWPER